MATHFVGDTAVLTGRTMRHVTRSPDTIITTAIMPIAIMLLFVYVFGVGFALGFRSGAGPLAWLAVVGLLMLFTLALTWIAIVPGLTAKSVDGVSGFSYPLIFLPFISSAFVPTGHMPGPVRAFADHQPVTSIVNTIRDLLTGQPAGDTAWIAVAWCAGILVVAYLLAVACYRRRIS